MNQSANLVIKKENTDGSGCGLNEQAQVHLRTMAEVGGSLTDGCAGGKDKICGARKELTWRKQRYDLQNFIHVYCKPVCTDNIVKLTNYRHELFGG